MTIWAVVPAAGIGSRMQSSIPKQYLKIKGQTVLELTLARLSSVAAIEQILVVLNPLDSVWPTLQVQGSDGKALPKKVSTCIGGQNRWQSVLNGLTALTGLAADDDWVLVHDAVRPCVRVADILSLIELSATDDVGGLLAIPVSDTLKRAIVQPGELERVAETINRDRMWSACTPQIFRFGLLRESLRKAAASGLPITDEASALESEGYQPLLIPCGRDNIKITHPDDLMLAELIFQSQSADTRTTI
jgi:2-C-methyl-D-erythritol 4-phosphate cytidylyltransferase